MNRFIQLAAAVAVVLGACASANAGPLYGIDYVNGNLYQVSSANAALTLVGNTGVQFMADIQFSPGGTLYGFTVGLNPVLYKIDPATAAATPVAPLSVPGSFLGEGALTFAPNGTAYAMNEVAFGSAVSHLITIDPQTGATTVVGALPAGPYDINGLAYRSDGMLVALDDLSN